MGRTLLAIMFIWATACLDSAGPVRHVDPLPDSLPDSPAGLIVSAPVAGSAGDGAASMLSPTASASGSLVYVSLVPGTVPTGVRATIHNRAVVPSLREVAVVDGGFDPVGIPATIGDTLLVEIEREGNTTLYLSVVVRPKRPPVVVRTSPPRGGRDVPLNSIMVLVFSEPIDSTSMTSGSVELWRGATPVSGTVRFADAAHIRAELHPDTLLAAQTDYQLVLTTTIRDLNGVALDSTVTVAFTTGPIALAGHSIAFESDRDGNSEIYVMDADGSDPVNLTNNPGGDYTPVWSPDGTRIAFMRVSVGDSTQEIYVMNADGSGLQNVTNDPGNDYGFAWSPDGTRIAFSSDRDGDMEFQTSEIYVMNADGSGLHNVTNNPGYDHQPVWSPDGTRIAFSSNRDGLDRIYVMNADGSGVTPLTTGQGESSISPAWSPDGTKIAFSGARDGNEGIYVINADGSGVVFLYSSPGQNVPSVWSPDGTRIAFHSFREGNSEIYVINADGSGLINITNNPGQDYVPAWSPIGSKIAFSSYRDFHPLALEIYVMNADGSGLINITNNPGQDWRPVWRPR